MLNTRRDWSRRRPDGGDGSLRSSPKRLGLIPMMESPEPCPNGSSYSRCRWSSARRCGPQKFRSIQQGSKATPSSYGTWTMSATRLATSAGVGSPKPKRSKSLVGRCRFGGCHARASIEEGAEVVRAGCGVGQDDVVGRCLGEREQIEWRARPANAVGRLGAAGDFGIVAVLTGHREAPIVEAAVAGSGLQDGAIPAESAFPWPVERQRRARINRGRQPQSAVAADSVDEMAIHEQFAARTDVDGLTRLLGGRRCGCA